jgi:ribosomal-protein-alanine N-acetyltransferase
MARTTPGRRLRSARRWPAVPEQPASSGLRPSLVAREAGLTLRRMRPDDAESVAALELGIFQEGWTALVYRRELENNKLARYFLLERGPELIGFCGIWCVVDEAHVVTIGVLPAQRRSGYGELLLQAGIRHARHRLQRSMTLEVRESNEAALALYDRYGFQQVGRRERYYSDNDEAALLLTREGLQTRAFNRLLHTRLRQLVEKLGKGTPGG